MFRDALAQHQAGRLADAEPLYRRILEIEPRHFDSCHLLGLVFHQRGENLPALCQIDAALKLNPNSASAHSNRGVVLAALQRVDEAIEGYDRAIALKPDYVDALFNRGNALRDRARLDEALASYDKAIALAPGHAMAVAGRANVLFTLGRFEQAVASYDRAIALDPHFGQAYNNRGAALAKLERFTEALASCEWAIALNPDDAEAFSNHGAALAGLGRYEEALSSYERAIALKPGDAGAFVGYGLVLAGLGRVSEAVASYDRGIALVPDNAESHNNRGNALCELERFEEALASYDRAIALVPAYAEALSNRGNALNQLRRFEEALATCDKAITLKPDLAEAFNNRGNAFKELRRFDEALESYDHAVALKPEYPDALRNRGIVLGELKRSEEALASYQRVIMLKPDHADAFYNQAALLLGLKRFDEAVASFDKAIALRPDQDCLKGFRLHTKMQACDWTNFDAENAELNAAIAKGVVAAHPFHLLACVSTPATQLECARIYVAYKYPAFAEPIWRGERYAHERIRVAYLSADLRDHPVAYLTAGLFARHDRSRFETTAISFAPDQPGRMRDRLRGSFDRFLDAHAMSDREVAELMRRLEIDIAVDLTGLTDSARPNILAMRPAPVQVSYLGYAGTLGQDYWDYVIADRFVIPEESRGHYAEDVVYLPDCYMVNDCDRAIASRTPSRTEAGLPETGFVFCCFNNSFKITPDVFGVWMRLLEEIDGSVLWLSATNPAAVDRLRGEATRRGVAADRLIFAPRVPLNEDHLARNRLADLFLDTLYYNAHTTAADALWAGVPVLACAGATFASRVAGSLLHAVGLPELVTTSLPDYEALALALARDPARLASVRAKLAENRDVYPLFDTARFARNLEAAYTTMWERAQRSELSKRVSAPAPSNIATLYRAAFAHHQAGRLTEAEALYRRILEIDARHFDSGHHLGLILHARGDHVAALSAIDTALKLNPRSAAAHSNRGVVLAALQRVGEAVDSYGKAIALKPDYVDALFNLGNALKDLARLDEALEIYDKVVALAPSHAVAICSRGNVLYALARYEESIASYERAISLKPDYAEAHSNHAAACVMLKRDDEAVASFKRAITLNPDLRHLDGMYRQAKMQVCDWANFEEDWLRLNNAVAGGKETISPFQLLACSSDPAIQLKCAELFVESSCAPFPDALWRGEIYSHSRIRLAYLSTDFRDHPVAYLTAGLFERHDRERFETTAISYGPDMPSAMRERLRCAFDRFVDASAIGDESVARLLRDLEIDIAIDLNGFTEGSRPKVLMHRPAPVHVSYLGYAGALGHRFWDYIIADRFVVPNDAEGQFGEEVVHLPDCFMVNDNKRSISARAGSRSEAGLPENGVVFCCFNTVYKITPDVFAVWMRLLAQVEGSVLWLSVTNGNAVDNLRRQAATAGVAPHRLVFAPKVALIEDHLARLRLADLFLDTLYYNAHATAADALWAGLPVLTCAGETFASRVAGSLLHAVGLPELVTTSLPDYEALALKLAREPALLSSLRGRLARNRDVCPLFDTERFTRRIEAAYATMWERTQRGAPPQGFAVPPPM